MIFKSKYSFFLTNLFNSLKDKINKKVQISAEDENSIGESSESESEYDYDE